MIIKRFIEPPIENNNYLIIDEESKEAVLIDCSAFDKKIYDTIKEYGADLKYILLTHGHFDHIGGIKPSSAKVVMNKDDLDILKKANQYLAMFGADEVTIPQIDVFIEDDDILKIGNKDIKVIQTPGHTQGGVCYLIENNLFSGDTIFKESVGRCDLEGGDFNQLVQSIKNKIFTLDDSILIYPGHGESSDIGWEKSHNHFL